MVKYLQGLAVLSVATLLLAGCAGTPVAGAGSTDAPASGGLAAAPGFDPATKTITVGSLVPVSGVFAGAITNLQGQQAYYNRATSKGGALEGYTIKLVNQDTKYDPAVAIPLYNSTKDSVAMWSMILGAPILEALLPSMRDEDMIAVPAGAISKFVHDPNVVPTFPSLNSYHAAVVQYAAEEKGKKDATFCSLSVEDIFGESSAESFDFAAESLGLKVGLRQKFAPGTDMTAEVSALKNAGCEVVDIAGVGTVVQDFAVKAVQLDFNPMTLSTNTAYNITMATGPGAEWLTKNAIFAVTGTEWGDDSVEGQKLMEEDLDSLGEKIVPTANAYQTGYINAMTTVAILAKAIESGDMSHANLLKVAHEDLGTIDDLGLAGGPYSYGSSPADRVPPHGMSFFTVDANAPTGLALQKFNYQSSVTADLNKG